METSKACALESGKTRGVDGCEISAGPGDSIFLPRGSAHTFQNVGAGPGRTVVIVQPAGFDGFLPELSEATRVMAQPDSKIVVPIFQKYVLSRAWLGNSF
jgi:uncharacterized cupin superfamily protein